MTLRLSWLFASLLCLGGSILGAQPKTIRAPQEYQAYMAAFQMTPGREKAAAMEAFLSRFPGTAMAAEALEHVMQGHQVAGDSGEVLKAARRLLTLAPDHVRALGVVVALDRAEATNGQAGRLPEMEAAARRGLRTLPAWTRPDEMDARTFDGLRTQLRRMFHGALGFAALSAKDYPRAREAYLEALRGGGSDLGDLFQAAISELSMNPLDPTGFWHAAKAVAVAEGSGNAKARDHIRAYAEARYARFHGSREGFDTLMRRAAAEAEPPLDFARSVTPAPTPAELAVRAVREHPVKDLSVSDWIFVLEQRDASPENQAAAAKVWEGVQAMLKGGTAQIQWKGRFVACVGAVVDLALTEDHQAAGVPDLQVHLVRAPGRSLTPGDMLEVRGRLAGYALKPFRFEMQEGTLLPGTP